MGDYISLEYQNQLGDSDVVINESPAAQVPDVAPTITAVSTTASPLYQWSVSTSTTLTGTITGTDFDTTGPIAVTVGGVAVTVGTVTATSIAFTIPSAEEASSPLHTAGAKDVTVTQGEGSSTLAGGVTVTAWDFDTPATPTVWLDADSAYTGSGASVTAWTERGSTNDFGLGVAPTRSNTALSGKPAVVYNGTSQRLVSSSALSSVIANNAYTIVAALSVDAVNLDTAAAWTNHAIFCDTGPYFGLFAKNGGGTTPTFQLYNSAGGNAQVERTFTTGQAYVFSGRHSGGFLYARLGLNAESAGVASGNTGALTGTLTTASRSAAAGWCDCNIGHFVIWNSVIDLDHRERAIAKLKYFYGI